MNTHNMIEMLGYFSSALVLCSFLMSSVVKLRVINSIGSIIFVVYAFIIASYPTALMNLCLVGINIYYLVRLRKTDRHYKLVEGRSEDTIFEYALNYYYEDMKKYFPEVDLNEIHGKSVYLVFCDADLAGIMAGIRENETFEIFVDYTTPAYRDCSVGKFLYSKLSEKKIHQLYFSGKAEKHKPYLEKMGFVKDSGNYMKKLI